MVPSSLNLIITVITFFLFMFYGVLKYYRNFIIRPTYKIIDDIYNDFYDVYFKNVTRSREYSYLDKIYNTMSAEFAHKNVSDDVIKNYISFLDERSKQYWFLPVITILTSFLGISNIESLLKFLNLDKIIKSNSLEYNIGIFALIIGVISIMFLVVIFKKIIFKNNLYRNTRDSWKKIILQDYLDFHKSNEIIDFDKLQQSRVILDFLSCFTLDRKKKKIKFKKDESIKVFIDNRNIDYNKLFEFSEKNLTIEYDGKKYLIQIQLMSNKRNIKVTPVILGNTDNNMSEDIEFRKLCEIKNCKVETMSQKSYDLPVIGWFYKLEDNLARDGKIVRKFCLDVSFYVIFFFLYIIGAFVIYFGGIFVLLFFVVYIFSDFLTTKIFRI